MLLAVAYQSMEPLSACGREIGMWRILSGGAGGECWAAASTLPILLESLLTSSVPS